MKPNDLSKMIDEAKETPIDNQQRPMESTVLSALALVANTDQSDLKYEILGMDADVFFFAEHRLFFQTVKALNEDGSHIDRLTVGERIEDAGTFFAAENFDEDQVRTYLKTLLNRAVHRQLQVISRDFSSAIDAADISDSSTLLAKLQKDVFDAERLNRIVRPVKTEAEQLDETLLNIEAPRPGQPTGFKYLDKVLQGGLRPGLFIIAGTPGAGKTTFAKQIADNMAEGEAPVLFFSYEQSAEELRLKTLARIAQIDNELLKGGKVKSDDRRLQAAVTAYRNFGDRMKIIEGDIRYTVATIRMMALQEQARMKKAPVIFIDYLQILPAGDLSQGEKRIQIDLLVSELRRIARDLETTVIAISAMSRAAYHVAKMDAFKESGGIEYAADVAAIMEVGDERSAGKDRAIDLSIIKNRNGRRGKISMTYQTNMDRFTEESEHELSYKQALKGEDNA